MVEECKRTGTDFQRRLAEVLRRLPTHRAAEGYLPLMPGILNLSDEKTGGREVSLRKQNNEHVGFRLQGLWLNLRCDRLERYNSQ